MNTHQYDRYNNLRDNKHKKTIHNINGIAIAIVLAIVAIGSAYVYKKNSEASVYTSTNTDEKLASVSIITNQLSDLDSDGDKLKDWEEVIWGSDPQNTDSDNDGTPDGIEVALGRNPAIKATDDSVTNAPAGTIQGVGEWNTTDRFSRELFTAYTSYKSSNGIDATEQEKIVAQMIAEVENMGNTPATVHTSSELFVVGNTPDEFKRYRNLFLEVTSRYQENIENNELYVLEKALKGTDSSSLNEIDVITDNYKQIAKELIIVPVPKEIEKQHLALINNYERLSVVVDKFKQVFTDPLIAMTSMTEYYGVANEFSLALQNVQNVLKKNNTPLLPN